MSFYFGLGLQILGMTLTGLCLFSGFNTGAYGKIELIQLVGGSLIFYLGNYFRSKSA